MQVQAQLALSELMDAVVIVDPSEYLRRLGEPERPLRTLPFRQGGLVTTLTYEPDDLVLVSDDIAAELQGKAQSSRHAEHPPLCQDESSQARSQLSRRQSFSNGGIGRG